MNNDNGVTSTLGTKRPVVIGKRALAQALRDIALRVTSDQGLRTIEIGLTRVGHTDSWSGTLRIGTDRIVGF